MISIFQINSTISLNRTDLERDLPLKTLTFISSMFYTCVATSHMVLWRHFRSRESSSSTLLLYHHDILWCTSQYTYKHSHTPNNKLDLIFTKYILYTLMKWVIKTDVDRVHHCSTNVSPESRTFVGSDTGTQKDLRDSV